VAYIVLDVQDQDFYKSINEIAGSVLRCLAVFSGIINKKSE
jgi:hypothetical protein